MCGEKIRAVSATAASVGSPPRVRGKVYRRKHIVRWLRITPACAGKSAFPLRSVRSCKDHPRVCGEKYCLTTWFATGLGSPPRVRGKGSPCWTTAAGCRITPACAGKSKYAGRKTGACKDHPRVCGEKHSGSSLTLLYLGITPACAGKSSLQYPAQDDNGEKAKESLKK